jgi:hypothetical protein
VTFLKKAQRVYKNLGPPSGNAADSTGLFMELAAVWPNFVNDILFRKSWMTMKNQQEIVGLFPTLHIACPERVGGSRTLSFSTTTG